MRFGPSEFLPFDEDVEEILQQGRWTADAPLVGHVPHGLRPDVGVASSLRGCVMRRWLARSILIVGGVLAGIEGASAQRLAFEVASIKPNRSGEQRRGFNTPGNRYVATNVTLSELI